MNLDHGTISHRKLQEKVREKANQALLKVARLNVVQCGLNIKPIKLEKKYRSAYCSLRCDENIKVSNHSYQRILPTGISLNKDKYWESIKGERIQSGKGDHLSRTQDFSVKYMRKRFKYGSVPA